MYFREIDVFVYGCQTDATGRWTGGGCLELAMRDPALLVRTLEVAELMRTRLRQEWEEAKRRAMEKGGDPDEAVAGMQSEQELFEEINKGLVSYDWKIKQEFRNICNRSRG